jgi:NUMOD4 motif.
MPLGISYIIGRWKKRSRRVRGEAFFCPAGQSLKERRFEMIEIKCLPGEEWKPIDGFDGKYLVSSCGRV